MEKIYKMTVVAVDPETNEEEVVVDDTYTGFLLCANCGDGKMAEVVMHDNIMDMANRLAQGKHTRAAVRLANVLMAMKRDDAEDAENALLREIMGE
jgi:hypothetical protein